MPSRPFGRVGRSGKRIGEMNLLHPVSLHCADSWRITYGYFSLEILPKLSTTCSGSGQGRSSG
jgi:hypothetical protein